VRSGYRIAAVALWALALVPVAGTFGQSTSPTLDAVGWWNKTQALPVQGNPSGLDDPTGLGLTTAPTVPAPATVPADGLYIANDASGPTAIAAVRYLVGGAGGTLTLQLADGAAATGTEEIVGCPAQGGFTPAQNGRWDAQPGYDPTACTLKGTLDVAAKTLTFDVPTTFASSLGDITVVIVPAVGSTTPFSLPLAKPENGSFVITSPPSAPVVTPSEAPAYTPGEPVFSPSTPSFAAPSAPSVATPEVAGGDAGAAPAVPVASTPAAALKDPSRASQIAAVIALAVIGAALWQLGKHPQRAPRLLGSVGGAAAQAVEVAPLAKTVRARGVGRFARQRDVPATPL
jgi:hypothetical protein